MGAQVLLYWDCNKVSVVFTPHFSLSLGGVKAWEAFSPWIFKSVGWNLVVQSDMKHTCSEISSFVLMEAQVVGLGWDITSGHQCSPFNNSPWGLSIPIPWLKGWDGGCCLEVDPVVLSGGFLRSYGSRDPWKRWPHSSQVFQAHL